jgi:hypothetical protein
LQQSLTNVDELQKHTIGFADPVDLTNQMEGALFRSAAEHLDVDPSDLTITYE